MGRPITDVDLATTALPAETTRRAEAAGLRAVPTGIEHGTITVIVEGRPFEVTTLREDVMTDGRRAVVAFGRDFSHDAMRRDFTINALFASADGTIRDHVEGLADIAARRVRFIGDPDTRIREDYLRILRFFRFHADYAEGPLDPAGLAACVRDRAGLARLSRERIWNEIRRLLVARRACGTVQEAAEAGFMDCILGGVPHLARFVALVRDPVRDPQDAVLRLAALAVETREDAERLRERLRLSNEDHRRIEAIAHGLERLRALRGLPDLTRLRLMALDIDAHALCDALTLVVATAGPAARAESERLAEGLSRTPAFPLAGTDVLNAGVTPGPAVGATLRRAREAWIADGCPGEETARALLGRLLAEAG
jgi:poly(A) polymerase